MHAFTGLPIMDIVTENRQDINSKEEYLYAAMTLKEDVVTRAPGDVIYQTVNIKGRGNATWNIYPKKPYRLKFDKKVSFFGEKEDKSWVLLANYADKTMMRTQIASYLGKMSQLDYTPSFHFVELILNGTYLGTYQLGEKIKISKNRVNIGDDGILLEMDGYAKDEEDSRYFYVEHMPQPVNVKEPEMEYSDERFAFVKQYMTEADSVLFSDGFKDKDTGWQKYFDMTSFVDWYLISEITKSIDSFWWSSTYMNIKPGGKLKMGPIWDYDHSFGNYIHEGETENPEGFYVGELYWYKRLMEDPVFREAVRTRFDYFYSRRNDILNEINENAEYLKYSAVENNNKWGTLYTFIWNDLTIWGSYLNEVEYMKEWLVKRFDWLNQNI